MFSGRRISLFGIVLCLTRLRRDGLTGGGTALPGAAVVVEGGKCYIPFLFLLLISNYFACDVLLVSNGNVNIIST